MDSFANLPKNVSPDPAVCPLCGEPNQCAVATDPDASQCWCELREFPEELIARIPENAVRKSCVCQNCLDQFIEGKTNQ